MSNEQMVSVPRADVELMAEPAAHKECISIRRHEAMFRTRALLGQPAAQHQSEPVEAIPLKDCVPGWHSDYNDGLFATQDSVVTLYTHADAAEVERLREKSDHLTEANRLLMDDCDTMRAQLAERDALLMGYKSLLRQVMPCLAMSTNSQSASYMRKIDAALSASAEPSAPAEITSVDQLGSDANCPMCYDTGSIVIDDTGEEYEMAPCPMCKGQDAPVERDERAGFEAYYVDWFNRKYSPSEPLTIESMLSARRGDNYGYGSLGRNGKWAGWKARAALERKPAMYFDQGKPGGDMTAKATFARVDGKLILLGVEHSEPGVDDV